MESGSIISSNGGNRRLHLQPCSFLTLPRTFSRLSQAPLRLCRPCKRPVRGCRRACRSEEHTSELQSRLHLVCRLLLEKKKTKDTAMVDVTDTTAWLGWPADRLK